MKMLLAALFFILRVSLVFSSRETYVRETRLDDHDANGIKQYSTSGHNIATCSRLCFESEFCLGMRIYKSECVLYRGTPLASTKLLAGARYYRLLSDPCTREDFMSVLSPRLCFKFHTAQYKTWTSSLATCQGEGGRLIVLDTEAKHDTVFHYYLSHYGNKGYVWVGMKKTAAGVPTWIGGSTFTHEWYPDEPDDVTYQDCIVLTATGLADVKCENLHVFACEIEIA